MTKVRRTPWSINGNEGIDITSQFLGNADAIDLPFRTNNLERSRFLSTGEFEITAVADYTLLKLKGFSGQTGNLFEIRDAASVLLSGAQPNGTIFSSPGAQNSENFGKDSSALGSSATALGKGADAAGNNSISIGRDSSVGDGNNRGIAIGKDAAVNSTNGIGIGANAIVGSSGSIMIGRAAENLAGSNVIGIGQNVDIDHSNVIIIGHDLVSESSKTMLLGHNQNNFLFGSGEFNAAPTSSMFWQPTKASGLDVVGTNLTIRAGVSTGSALGGTLFFETTNAAGSGTGLNTSIDRMVIMPAGQVIIGNATSALAHLDVRGEEDEIQLLVKANASQTKTIVEVQNSSSTIFASFNDNRSLDIQDRDVLRYAYLVG